MYREISGSQLPEILIQSAAVTGAVGLLLATAGVISWFLTVQQLPTMLIRLMTIVPGGSLVFFLITDRATRAVLPFIVAPCVGLVVIIVVLWFTLVLPRIFKLL